MLPDLSTLSVQQIRMQFAGHGQAISPPLLEALKRDPRRGVQALYGLLLRRCKQERQEHRRILNMQRLERRLWGSGLLLVAGVDEAGVGPLAGPVVAAAVICPPSMRIAGVNDSKQLDATRRAALAEAIHAGALGVGVGVAEVEEIDRCNIYQASLQAMARAIRALPMRPEHLLVDARSLPGIGIPQESIIHGDGLSFSIAAASIIAKTHRDQLMQELDRCYPGYGLARHKGYGTAEHLQALHERGPSPIHRKSYAPVRRSMEQAGCS